MPVALVYQKMTGIPERPAATPHLLSLPEYHLEKAAHCPGMTPLPPPSLVLLGAFLMYRFLPPGGQGVLSSFLLVLWLPHGAENRGPNGSSSS